MPETSDDANDWATDDWAETQIDEAVDNAKDSIDRLVEEKKSKLPWTGPSATFTWYQPKKAESYLSLRRYSAGDLVNVYTVSGDRIPANDGPFTLTQQASQVRLTGATTLITGMMALGAAILAL